MLFGDDLALKGAMIRPGSIFRMTLTEEDGITPKGGYSTRVKYFVIAGVDKEGNYVGVSLINTDVNIRFARMIAPFQLCIYPDRYSFLNGKYRYVDCYSIKHINRLRILQEAKYIAQLEEMDLDKVKRLLKASPTMDAKTIQQYGL